MLKRLLLNNTSNVILKPNKYVVSLRITLILVVVLKSLAIWPLMLFLMLKLVCVGFNASVNGLLRLLGISSFTIKNFLIIELEDCGNLRTNIENLGTTINGLEMRLTRVQELGPISKETIIITD